MDLVEQLRSWTYRRLRLGAYAAPSVGEALSSVVAVYSAHPTAPLALWARTAGMTADGFRDVERCRRALRIPGMRGTLFLAPVELAPCVFAPGRLGSAELAARLGRADLTEQEYRVTADRLVAAARTPLLPAELEPAAGVAGLRMSILIRTMRGEGLLLAVPDAPLRAARLRYVATAGWAPGSLAGGDDESAFAALAGHYLAAYGPARIVDFAWWAGVPRGVATRAIEAHRTIRVDDQLLLLAEHEPAFSAVKGVTNAVDVLPKWDPYTMGYAPDGRARLVAADRQRRIYVQKGVGAPGQPNVGLPGDGYPVVLVDGEAIGTWNLTLKGTTVDLFENIGPRTRQRLDDRLAAAQAVLSG